jgi:hypothetical protein
MNEVEQAISNAVAEEQTYRPCECSLWFYQDGDEREYETSCGRDVSGDRNFAQGHDAKLKSLLIDAGVLGVEVGRRANGFTTWMSAEAGAFRFGFGHQVSDGITSGRTKADKKTEKARARELKKAEKDVKKRKKEQANGQVQIKVGRWKYNVVEETAGTYVYIDNKGEEQQVAKSKAKIIA